MGSSEDLVIVKSETKNLDWRPAFKSLLTDPQSRIHVTLRGHFGTVH